MNILGRIVDVPGRKIFGGELTIEKGIIRSIKKKDIKDGNYILPGLIDAHVHIESSMLTPGSFALASVPHGTIAVVSDPHEIANVLGIEGVEYMINDAGRVPLKFFFGAPSCVPATDFESSGAKLGPEEIEKLLIKENVKYLAEMMNFPGVINGDKDVLKKIDFATSLNKPVDGHAPGLSGESLRRYVKAGISTDHECSSLEEAIEKIALGMKIIIREGSAGRNLSALKDLLTLYPGMIMLCSDDIHPEMLQKRHMDKIVAGLINEGYDIFDVLACVSTNPVAHYKLNAGLLQPGDPADFIVVDDPAEMNIFETWIDGKKVFDRGQLLFDYEQGFALNNFNCSPVHESMIAVRTEGYEYRVITAFDGELFTKETLHEAKESDFINSDIDEDILKIVVKDRYRDQPPATGFIKGFGLNKGAFASSVAHDSHNIICIGTNDKDIVTAINELVKLKGGLAVSVDGKISSMQLNIAGIMSNRSCGEIATEYEKLSAIVRQAGCKMSAPFMTLSFMALLVIPELKLSDRGLFDGVHFRHVPLFTDSKK